MIQKIKNNMLLIASMLMFALPGLVPVAATAATTNPGGCANSISSNLANGASSAANDGNTGNIDCTSKDGAGESSISSLASKAVNLFSIIVGAVAVIMIIYGGFRYITSGGDSGNVGNAKNTLIYAIVGLIIVALAQIIVHFVLAQTTSATTGI